MEVDWTQVWGAVAAGLRDHLAAGRGHLLTEDVVRMSTVVAMQDRGVDAARLAVEVPASELGGGKLDLVMDGVTGTVIELKFPRGSRTGISPDTMTLGELIRDILRVAVVPARQRWVVQVINERLQRYLTNLATRHKIRWPAAAGETLILERAVLAGLPRTSLNAIGSTPWLLPVTAQCVLVEPAGTGLQLFAYHVEPAPTAGAGTALTTMPAVHNELPTVLGEATTTLTDQARTDPARLGSAPRRRGEGGARAEILQAIRAIVARTGDEVVTVAQVMAEMRRRETRYADSTIRTMMVSHLCVDTQGPGIDTYQDLERLGRGQYRIRHTPMP